MPLTRRNLAVPGPARTRREAVDAVEGGHVTTGGGEELGAELDAESGHAQDDLGVAVAAKSVLDHRFGVADFGVEGHHLLASRATIAAAICWPGTVLCWALAAAIAVAATAVAL
ncbi:hypothetical protein MAGR_21880 [Mycolicibacterium agri]|uniref:Uncharacterized protein n=1 Tax=Mycolicibacterium agri TaxID=36811 RepID=A0A7I9W0D1_MYCAG|nr:hypothetical protein MAGR_21880 [Mycolicibacterium agri]